MLRCNLLREKFSPIQVSRCESPRISINPCLQCVDWGGVRIFERNTSGNSMGGESGHNVLGWCVFWIREDMSLSMTIDKRRRERANPPPNRPLLVQEVILFGGGIAVMMNRWQKGKDVWGKNRNVSCHPHC